MVYPELNSPKAAVGCCTIQYSTAISDYLPIFRSLKLLDKYDPGLVLLSN